MRENNVKIKKCDSKKCESINVRLKNVRVKNMRVLKNVGVKVSILKYEFKM